MSWEAESLRITVFTAGHPTEAPVTLEQISGSPADEVVEQPKAGIRSESAEFDGGKLFLTRQPGRIDLVLGVTPSSGSQASAFANVGAYENAREEFHKLGATLLRASGPVSRLAYGPILLRPVADRETGYYKLAEMLPSVKVDAENSLDMLWQVNRPRMSKSFENVKINRLTKWSVVRLQLLAIHFSDSPGPELTSAPDTANAVRLELDINTSPGAPVLQQEQVIQLLSEFFTLADEIAEHGDVP